MAKEAGCLSIGKQEGTEPGWLMCIFLFMFWDFHTALIWSYSFSSPNSSQIPHLQIMYSSLLKNQTSMHTPKTWSLICIGQLLLSMRSALDYGWYNQYPTIEEIGSLFPRIYPLEITFWLEAGLPACFPFSLLGFCSAWVCACLLQAVRHWKGIPGRLLKRKVKEMEVGILVWIIIHDTWEKNFKKIK